MRIFTVCIALTLTVAGCAGNVQWRTPVSPDDWDRASEGFRKNATVVHIDPSTAPRNLEYSPEDSAAMRAESIMAPTLNKIMGMRGTRILIISSNKNIIYSRYASNSLKSSTPLGYSMSKSLTSLAIGKLLCKNPSVTLKTKGKDLVAGHDGTSWGESTLEQILMMQSGSSVQEPARAGWQSELVGARHRPIYWGGNKLDISESMRSDDTKAFAPGVSFQYNNYDTLFLGLVIEAVSGMPFHKFFKEEIWDEVGAKHSGAWFVNEKGQTYTASGFSADPEDWIRIGNYVIERMQKEDCFGEYLKKATFQIQRSFVPTRCYGYQIWSWCNKDAFFFLGYGGQYLVMSPSRRWVAYAHQTTHDNDRELIGALINAMYSASIIRK
jgi:CubicO group peptidase (beta-lactamase class C family)